MKKTEIFQVGGYSNKVQAEQEARDFAKPEVFRNRSAFFPNPVNHKVQVHTASAVVKPWPKTPSPFNQFFIELTIDVEGEEKRIVEWCKRVRSALQVNVPGAALLGERAKHLADIGKTPKNGMPAVAAPNGGMIPGERARHLAERGIAPAKKEGAKH
jgi:hypothetical protein